MGPDKKFCPQSRQRRGIVDGQSIGYQQRAGGDMKCCCGRAMINMPPLVPALVKRSQQPSNFELMKSKVLAKATR